MPRGRNRGEREYRALLAEFADSKETLPAFARRKGVPYSTLAMWRQRLSVEKPAGPSSKRTPRRRPRATKTPSSQESAARQAQGPAFLPVKLAFGGRPPGPSGGDAAFEVFLRAGHVVRVPADFDPERLKALVGALEVDPC